jgi:hypothetical protein
MVIDIEKVAKYLSELNVSENYNWPIPFYKGHGYNLFSQEELLQFTNLTNFESNVRLKSLVSEKIKSAKNNYEENLLKNIFEWIVHDWGGISNGRQNIDKLFNLGIDAIKNVELNFDRIASTSKILSFYQPSDFIIYDSRIAYSLNAIMLFLNATEKYFPVPPGKNPKMNAFNIEVLIRLKHKSNVYKRTGNKKIIANADNTLFFKKNDAYSIINNTVKEINKIIYKNDRQKMYEPFYTEMLLFGIADTLIYDKIIEKININIEKI